MSAAPRLVARQIVTPIFESCWWWLVIRELKRIYVSAAITVVHSVWSIFKHTTLCLTSPVSTEQGESLFWLCPGLNYSIRAGLHKAALTSILMFPPASAWKQQWGFYEYTYFHLEKKPSVLKPICINPSTDTNRRFFREHAIFVAASHATRYTRRRVHEFLVSACMTIDCCPSCVAQ